MLWIDAEGNCWCIAWYGPLGKGDQGHPAGPFHSSSLHAPPEFVGKARTAPSTRSETGQRAREGGTGQEAPGKTALPGPGGNDSPTDFPTPNTLTLSFPEASGQGRPNICPVGRSQAMGPVALDVGPSSIWSS